MSKTIAIQNQTTATLRARLAEARRTVRGYEPNTALIRRLERELARRERAGQ